jgi:hypothetical protein
MSSAGLDLSVLISGPKFLLIRRALEILWGALAAVLPRSQTPSAVMLGIMLGSIMLLTDGPAAPILKPSCAGGWDSCYRFCFVVLRTLASSRYSTKP